MDLIITGKRFNLKIYLIHDEETLAKIEAQITAAKTAELELQSFKNGFDDSDYWAIHRYLFSDLYDWAGEYRTVGMSKKGTPFAVPDEIS